MSDQNKIGPVNAFSDMFKKHLEKSNRNLLINNLVLLRNVFKQAALDSHLEEREEAKIRNMEEIWETLNKGCGCTRNKRIGDALKATIDFVSSDEGKAILRKIKTAFNLNSLIIDIPDPVFKCEI